MELSFFGHLSSHKNITESKREIKDRERPVFLVKDSIGSKKIPLGLVAPKIVQRVFSERANPLFANDTLCCSIASWITPESTALTAANSSMQHNPPSAKTRAPPSSDQPVSRSTFIKDAVRPAVVVPEPVASMARGAI
jgi:hypothetical protein